MHCMCIAKAHLCIYASICIWNEREKLFITEVSYLVTFDILARRVLWWNCVSEANLWVTPVCYVRIHPSKRSGNKVLYYYYLTNTMMKKKYMGKTSCYFLPSFVCTFVSPCHQHTDDALHLYMLIKHHD